MMRSLMFSIAAAAAFAGAAVVGGCGPSQATPVAAPAGVETGDRIRFPEAKRLEIPASLGTAPEIKSLLNVPGRMNYGDYVWNDRGVPQGRTWIFVDLAGQTLSVFRGEHEIGTSVLLYGADDKPTPLGRFKILERRKDHFSRTYDAPMPYTLRLTDDGVAIHASNVRWGYATHGCIGVPEGFAAKLFEAMKVGDHVLIVDGTAPARARAA